MIAPDDTRHGERRGYIAGCRDECCRNPHVRYQKRSNLRRHREGTQYVPSDRITARLASWERYGVTTNAITESAGLGEGTLNPLRPRVLKSTEARVLAVTWRHLPDTALVYADLTRHRIYSLMAAGHQLTWICDNVTGLNIGGKWREQEKVTLGLARNVQALYDRAPIWGPSKATASKARNKGHGTPAAWDDPGTPAAPQGWAPAIDRATRHRSRDDIDQAVVERILAGEKLPTTRAEKVEILRRWKLTDRPLSELERVTGWKSERYGKGAA